MPLTLSPVFQSHMVLQRELPIRISGNAEPGARVLVQFAGHQAQAIADQSGQWQAVLPPAAASREPRELTVTAPDQGEAIILSDVLVGDVWVCSGQSNMEWPLSQTDDAETDIPSADHPEIRLFTVQRRPAPEPRTDLPNAVWSRCSPKSAELFSAVGYYFGLELHRRLGIPVGLIHSSWGGTPAESWVSRDGLLGESRLADIHKSLNQTPETREKLIAEYQQKLADQAQRTADAENMGLSRGWAGTDFADHDWSQMRLPTMWQSAGLKFSGVLWFRKTVELPPAWAGKDLELAIGAADKGDITYFNAVPVGSVTMKDRPDSWNFRRVYTVPANLVKGGANTIAVRVMSDIYDGGLTGPASAMYVRCPADPGTPAISLAGDWRYMVEKNFGVITPLQPPTGAPDNPNTPTVLYNGMIHPILPLTPRGAIWYQGESNADRSEEYQTLLPALIKDWRRKWGRDDLAFHIVQLANWQKRFDQPTDSNWAKLREAQEMALQLPHTGLAVTIDIGDAEDIHPRNKKDVGLRLACSALHRTYGMKDVVPSGPQYRELKIEGRSARILFDYSDGLVCRGESLQGFAVAGTDKKFHWADARIDGNSIVLTCDAVPAPVAVRYAWADNPVANLYNAAGLPAVPFRTDRW